MRGLPPLALALALSSGAAARPNTHAPAISTWDPRASSVVFGLGRAVSGDGAFTFTSYNANFSSTNGVLSAQFGVHYTTFKDTDDGPTARGVSAGGVALISLPLASRFENGVPGSSFAFYIGGVPTAMFSGQLNYISVPLVLGMGLPFSPSPYVTFRPWVELSPGLNFDTRIQAVSTDSAIQSAMDGTLTRAEVEALVEEGLDIQRATTVGKRAGLSIGVHLGQRVDFDANVMLGAGHPGALSLGAGLVLRWDAMVHELERDGADRERLRRERKLLEDEEEDCAALAARYHRTCRLRTAPPAGRAPAHAPGSTRVRATPPQSRTVPAPAGVTRARQPVVTPRSAPLRTPAAAPRPSPPSPRDSVRPTAGGTAPATKKPAPAAPTTPGATPPATSPKLEALPPLQAAPPRTP